jgi:hypothetical protein
MEIKNCFEGRLPRRTTAPEGYELPPAAVSLLETATEHGWRTGWLWGSESGGSPYTVTYGDCPYVTVRLAPSEEGPYLKYTWHSRDCAPGRMRLFSKLIRPAGKDLWQDGPSVKTMRKMIKETDR